MVRLLLALTALVVIAASACVEPESSTVTCGGPTLERPLIVLESDEKTTSSVARLDRNGCLTEVAGGLALSADTSLSISRGRVFVCDRSKGVVYEIDPAGPSIARTFSAAIEGEPRPNPWDAAVDASGNLWIARYDLPSLAVLGADGARLATIDLPSADADGIPEAEAITIIGDTAYVALQGVPHDAIVDDPPAGLLARVRTTAPYDLGPAIALRGGNPFGRLGLDTTAEQPALIVSTPGSWSQIGATGSERTDGIERVDLMDEASTTLVDETALGGSSIEAVIANPDSGYAIVADTSTKNVTRLVRFDPTTGKLKGVLASTDGFYLAGLVAVGPYVVVGDATPGQARLRWFDASTGAEAGWMPVQHAPPLSMVVLEDLSAR